MSPEPRAAAPDPLLVVEDLEVIYRAPGLWRSLRGRSLPAVTGVSFDILPGETLALVGESGSGKSTIARAVEGLVRVRSGSVRLPGHDITGPIQRRAPDAKRRIQLVFQNPDASLNPRHVVATILSRPLTIFRRLRGTELRLAATQLLSDVQLDEAISAACPDSSVAASGRGWRSPVRSPLSPTCCYATRFFRRSTSRFRRV